MASFEVKYRTGSEVKSTVLTAPDEEAAGKLFGSLHQGISADDVISVRETDKYHSKYGAANFVAAVISFGGWVVLVLGIVGAIAGVVIARQLIVDAHGFDPMRMPFVGMAMGGTWLSLSFALIGLLMAAIGQHLRATTYAANCLGEMLLLMKSGKT